MTLYSKGNTFSYNRYVELPELEKILLFFYSLRTILPNGSLKLDIINEYSNLYSSSNKTETSQFRCLASDSFGTITSNPVKIHTPSSSKFILHIDFIATLTRA